MAIVIEIWHRADAPSPTAPRSDDVEIGVEMFQYFCADDRIVVARIRSAIEGVADKKQLWTPGAAPGIADRLGAEVEATITAVVFLQDHLRQEAAPAPDFEDRTAAMVPNATDDFAKQPVVTRPRHGLADLRMHGVVKIRAQLPLGRLARGRVVIGVVEFLGGGREFLGVHLRPAFSLPGHRLLRRSCRFSLSVNPRA